MRPADRKWSVVSGQWPEWDGAPASSRSPAKPLSLTVMTAAENIASHIPSQTWGLRPHNPRRAASVLIRFTGEANSLTGSSDPAAERNCALRACFNSASLLRIKTRTQRVHRQHTTKRLAPQGVGTRIIWIDAAKEQKKIKRIILLLTY